MRDSREREEALLEVTRENRTVPLVFDRLSLRVQNRLDSLDDVIATRQEELEQFDMRLKHVSTLSEMKAEIQRPLVGGIVRLVPAERLIGPDAVNGERDGRLAHCRGADVPVNVRRLD